MSLTDDSSKRSTPVRSTPVRSLTIPNRRPLTKDEVRYRDEHVDEPSVSRPKTRGDCDEGLRPCPWVSCKYHVYVEVDQVFGSLKINRPDIDPTQLEHSCALDVADRDGVTLEEVGQIFGITREGVRQIELIATRKVRRKMGRDWRPDKRQRCRFDRHATEVTHG